MYREFGIRLRQLRLENRYKLKDIAAVCNVSIATVSQWESSKQEPGLEDLVKMARFFRTSTDDLLDFVHEF